MVLTRDDCDRLYRAYAASAFRRAQRMLGSVADADEVVHDVFLALFEHPEKYQGNSLVSTYLYSAVTHACLNRLRNRRTRERLGRAHGEVEPTVDPGTASEWRTFALHLLAQLPPELGEVAVYHHVDELSHREIARVMGCSHTQVARLLMRLSGWLSEWEKKSCQP